MESFLLGHQYTMYYIFYCLIGRVKLVYCNTDLLIE
jgi:hypothetical protein